MSECTGILPNPDVSGIGIRVSLYATIILLAIVPRIPHTAQLVGALTTSAGLNGLAVLITAIVQTAQGQLDLYHAIFILHLLAFLGISASPNGLYKWSTLRVGIVSGSSVLGSLALVCFSFYVWANAPTFGSQPECNSKVIYVILFFPVPATATWLRAVLMAGLGLVSIGLLVAMLVLPCLLYARKLRSTQYNSLHSDADSELASGEDDDPNATGVVARLVSAVFGIITLEMTVKANNVDEENVWSFGQILAVVLLFSSLNELLHFFLGLWRRANK
ncbi:hypothetical protein M408DRAFT_177929 [Serendipita vermifera MAFF 305830]|uniref:Uncharacterized protein n=1 Tax=Serendipita vermifera MAFF 305830 TaxID=933852 RepID=A0A0C3AQF5_SERVB|nr:hypothetical protein M408DRAFT_177929 [Serendipita vermifera MAFF 305830]